MDGARGWVGECCNIAKRTLLVRYPWPCRDRLLEVNDYPVFDGWRNFNAETAKKHARAELALYKKRKKIEAMGIEYDEEALAAGEYDEVLMN